MAQVYQTVTKHCPNGMDLHTLSHYSHSILGKTITAYTQMAVFGPVRIMFYIPSIIDLCDCYKSTVLNT